MDRIGIFFVGLFVTGWGLWSFKKRSFRWRGSPRDEKTEPQEPVIFWVSAMLCLFLAMMAFGSLILKKIVSFKG